nr:SsrA-binding protein SmpB [Parasutterella muris]
MFLGDAAVAIIQNKKARFDYTIEDKFEAGLVLRGWEVKSIRAGGASIKESHIFVRDGELFLLNANITPLKTASTHEKADPTRTRKLLMHKHEIMRLIGRVEQAGYTLIPLDMHFKDGRVKLEIGLGKGKKLYEKRQDASKKEWKRQQERLLKTRNR